MKTAGSDELLFFGSATTGTIPTTIVYFKPTLSDFAEPAATTEAYKNDY
jgi:hypothetical protein